MQIVRRSTLLFQGFLVVLFGVAGAVIGAEATPVGAWLGLPAAALVAWLGLRKPLRRWRSARRPLGADARAWLEAHVVLYRHLGAEARRRFERDVRFVLDEWTFEGVAGVEVTDTLRLSVAAGAALLLHGRPDWELPAGHTVLFYPGSFDGDYLAEEEGDFDGMAHAQGPIILAVDAVEASWAAPTRGSNVVLHELSHLLDYANAFADGVPSLLDPASASAWDKLVRREMQRVRVGRSLLRSYAATNPAEFFAVAVENFFERPVPLRKRHPELFDALVAFFNLDPTPPDAIEPGEDPAVETWLPDENR